MENRAIAILDAHRVMAVSTIRPDGWPQVTIVGYANDGLLLYFLISDRKSTRLNSSHIQKSRMPSSA